MAINLLLKIVATRRAEENLGKDEVNKKRKGTSEPMRLQRCTLHRARTIPKKYNNDNAPWI